MHSMNRRRFLGAGMGAGLLMTGCDLSLRYGVFNACRADLPADLRDHPLVQAAWRDLDSTKVWDTHCHAFGNGDSGSGLWFNPRMEDIWQPRGYIQKVFYVNASCTDESTGKADTSFVERLLVQCRAMAPGFQLLLFGFDWARDDAGAPMQERSTFHVPDEYVAGLVASHPSHFEWAASIHPYDPRALDRLDAAAARGARAIKWLPSAQNIDPADARCDRFYAKLAALRMPLITHAGDEQAVHGFGEHLGNPLRLRRPLDAGVRVVVAHCASLGSAEDTDRKSSHDAHELRPVRAADGRAAVSHQPGRRHRGHRAEQPDGRDRHAARTPGLARPPVEWLGLSAARCAAVDRLAGARRCRAARSAAREPLHRLRGYNVLLFDFVLKRSLASNGRGFAPAVFETAPFFRSPV